jgi:hypothetical protein
MLIISSPASAKGSPFICEFGLPARCLRDLCIDTLLQV